MICDLSVDSITFDLVKINLGSINVEQGFGLEFDGPHLGEATNLTGSSNIVSSRAIRLIKNAKGSTVVKAPLVEAVNTSAGSFVIIGDLGDIRNPNNADFNGVLIQDGKYLGKHLNLGNWFETPEGVTLSFRSGPEGSEVEDFSKYALADQERMKLRRKEQQDEDAKERINSVRKSIEATLQFHSDLCGKEFK